MRAVCRLRAAGAREGRAGEPHPDKTIIGLGVLGHIAASALVITTNNVSVHRWRDELLAKTTIAPEAVGEYTGQSKNVKPVTITTYQMLTYRKSKDEPMENLELFQERNWGLIDDVPWKTLENRGYIAEAFCTEYRVPLPPDEERAYAHANKRNRFRIASENSRKAPLAEELIANHADDHILIIGQ